MREVIRGDVAWLDIAVTKQKQMWNFLTKNFNFKPKLLIRFNFATKKIKIGANFNLIIKKFWQILP